MDKIKCPNCGTEFDVEEALSGKIEEHYKQEYEKKIKQQYAILKQKEENKAKELEKKQAEFEALLKDFEEKKEKENELFAKRIEKEKERIKAQTQKESEEAVSLKMKALEEENEKRKAENTKLKEQEIALMKKAKEVEEQAEELKRKAEKELILKQREIEEKAKAKERESFELEKKELLKQIEDNKKMAEEMKRKAEQGSMQLQGEIQELALEELLAAQYPFDQIQEVPKGIRGADCIQVVYNSFQQECGSIVYESKRTKNFANNWIDKLKEDQLACKADLAVIVSETLPPEINGFGEKDGVWICGFKEVSNLSFILRQMLIRMHSIKKQDENKGGKMEMLYAYFTSPEFVQTVKRILDNQQKMKEHLEQEKRAYSKIWKQREKQIWAVEENVSSLFGSISGITGRELEGSSFLELPEGEDD